MIRKIVLVLAALSLLVFAGCDPHPDKTELVIRNASDSTAYIRFATITQYIGGGEEVSRVSLINSLNTGTLQPGDSSVFEIAPYYPEGYPLKVEVQFYDITTNNQVLIDYCLITYEAGTTFTLTCNNTDPTVFSVSGDGASLAPN